METEMRKQTHLENIATIIQIGHVNKHTSEEIAADVMIYVTAADEVFTSWEAYD
jgi:carbamate kinase